MADKDPSDDELGDDELFNDVETIAHLDHIAAQAAQASQVNRKTTHRYHHTVAPPKNNGSRPPPPKTVFGGRKDPGPVNTEPRAVAGGFGWEHGGKRSMDGNVDRYIAQVEERQAYWNQSDGVDNQDEADEDYPDVVMHNGTYGVAPGEVLDTHAQPSTAASAKALFEKQREKDEARKAQAAAARQAAIQADSISQANDVGPYPITARQMTKSTSGPLHQPHPKRFDGSNRTFSRSHSTGGAPIARPSSRGQVARLSPIPSSSQPLQPPSSQGAVARKVAIELEEERKKSEALEAELKRVKAQLAEQQRSRERKEQEGKRKVYSVSTETDAKKVEDPEIQKKLDTMQTDLYRAKGEAEQMRRAQKEETARHIAEADRLRSKIGDMEVKLREREQEAARQVENVKTQAVFANHAAQNSAMKGRAASQRPITPQVRDDSPRGKGNEESFLIRSSSKGKAMPPPPAPKFGALNNAFATSPKIKKTRLNSVLPTEDFSPPKPTSPIRSPTRSHPRNDDAPKSPLQDYGERMDIDMDHIEPLPPDTPSPELHGKSEFLYHLFNYVPQSSFQVVYDDEIHARPALYRILHFQSPFGSRAKEYGRQCSALLAACGDMSSSMEDVYRNIGQAFCGCLDIAMEGVKTGSSEDMHLDELANMMNIIALLARTAYLFHAFGSMLASAEPSITDMLRSIVNKIFADKAAISSIDRRLEEEIKSLSKPRESLAPSQPVNKPYQPVYNWSTASQLPISQAVEKPKSPKPVDAKITLWTSELGGAISHLVSALCLNGRQLNFWSADELVDITLGLTAPWLSTALIIRSADIFWAASLVSGNFRSLIVQSERWPGPDPALERMSKLLLELPKDASGEQVHQLTMTLIRALSMLSIADSDGIVLIGQRSSIVPALVSVLRRATIRLWGVWVQPVDIAQCLETITYTMTLFHHLVFPHFTKSFIKALTSRNGEASTVPPFPLDEPTGPEAEEDRIQGINLIAIFKDVRLGRLHKGWDHHFVSSLGALSWGSPVEDIDDRTDFDLAHIQDMAQDVLEVLMEGPEEDAIYELWVDEEEEELEDQVMNGREEGDGDEEVDQEALKQVVYEVEDDSE